MNMPSPMKIVARLFERQPAEPVSIESMGDFVRIDDRLLSRISIDSLDFRDSEIDDAYETAIFEMNGRLLNVDILSCDKNALIAAVADRPGLRTTRPGTGFLRRHKRKLIAVGAILLVYLLWPNGDQPAMPAITSLDEINQPQAYEIETPEARRIREALSGIASPDSGNLESSISGAWPPKLIVPEIKAEPLDCDKTAVK